MTEEECDCGHHHPTERHDPAVLDAPRLDAGLWGPGEHGAPAAVHSHHAGDLVRILEPGTNVVVWRRPTPPWVDSLHEWAASGRSLEQTYGAENFDLSRLFAPLPDPVRQEVQADAENLVRGLLAIYPSPNFKLSLATIRGDQCRKFHMDYVRLRLICSYVGPGTEWLMEGDVMRDVFQRNIDCPDEANRAIVRPGSAIQRVDPGDVVIFKGLTFPGVGERGAVHRSPPIEGTGVTRVVLTVSLMDGPERRFAAA